jgi:hypothetical protein
VPSLHVGFGAALAFAARRPWTKLLVALWAGLAVTAAGLAAGGLAPRRDRRCDGRLRAASSST